MQGTKGSLNRDAKAHQKSIHFYYYNNKLNRPHHIVYPTAAMPPSSPSKSHSFQIIVVPPAEDFQPDYLVFDADDLPDATEPDCASLDDALTRLHGPDPPPTFNRISADTVVMPRLSESRPEPDVADETVRDDSEIVEVVKVRRAFSQETVPQPDPQQKSTSLRSRASRAFRSIKNVARSSSRSRPYAQDVFATSQSTQATFATAPPVAPPPPLARRGSIILTQLFRAPSHVDPPSPSSTLEFLASGRYSEDDDDDDDDRESMVPRAPSPSPSARTFSSTVRRRLSIVHLLGRAPNTDRRVVSCSSTNSQGRRRRSRSHGRRDAARLAPLRVPVF
jgi:hypothetical protein